MRSDAESSMTGKQRLVKQKTGQSLNSKMLLQKLIIDLMLSKLKKGSLKILKSNTGEYIRYQTNCTHSRCFR